MEGIGKGRMTGIRIVGEILSVERIMAKLKGPLTDNWRHNFRRCGLFFRSLCNRATNVPDKLGILDDFAM